MKQNKIKKTEDIDILKEVESLSKKADLSTNQQLDLFKEDLGDEDIDSVIDFSPINDMADPQKSYKLWYGIRRLLIDYLPKGAENKKLRQYIYDEKNLFLKAGLNTGADGRQAYISNFLTVAFKEVSDWILSGSNPYDIFIRFRDLNTERGYHEIKEEKPVLSKFDNKLKKALDYNPKDKD